MPKQKPHKKQDGKKPAGLPLAFFAFPNSDCAERRNNVLESAVDVYKSNKSLSI